MRILRIEPTSVMQVESEEQGTGRASIRIEDEQRVLTSGSTDPVSLRHLGGRVVS